MSSEKSETRDPGFIGLPRSRLGRWSVGLEVAFLLLFAAWLSYMRVMPMDRPTFFSDPLHAVLILSAAACGIGGALSGAMALLMRREHSWMILLSVLVGSVVIYWAVGEIIGQ